MTLIKLTATIKREKNVFSAGMLEDIKDKLFKRLKAGDPEFNQKENTDDLKTSIKNKIKILEAAASAICTKIGIPANETNKYKGWILSLIGAGGIGFKVVKRDDDGIWELEDGNEDFQKLLKKYYRLTLLERVDKDIYKLKSIEELMKVCNPHTEDTPPAKSADWINFFKSGTELNGAEVLFSNGTYSVYHVEGTHADTIDALIKMSGKDPQEVKEKGQSATRLFTNCSWCTANEKDARNYLRENISLTMFYENGLPLFELLGAQKGSSQWGRSSGEFHNASNGDVPLTKLAKLIRTMEMPKEKRKKIWKALVFNTQKKIDIANDIIDEPGKHGIKKSEWYNYK